MQKPIALDPGAGGCCIGTAALLAADIIVSTTGAGASGSIRIATRSVVSHAALYAGGEQIAEAIGSGVTIRSAANALKDDLLAVAYRSPSMTDKAASAILNFVRAQVAAKATYSVAGAIRSADPLLCRIIGPKPAAFFCSQLVVEAYARGGIPLTTLPAQCVTPEGLAEIAFQRLVYVGHIKGDPAWFPVLSP